MLKIPLINSVACALIDDEDFDKIKDFKWSLFRCRRRAYAATSTMDRTLMHTLILASKPGFVIDHKDRDGLNNQKFNLRYATESQNIANKELTVANRSGFKGVSWNSAKQRWVSQIKTQGKSKHLGYFDSPIDAAKVYNRAAVELFGEFAYLNQV